MIKLHDLPAIGTSLDGGIFAGIITLRDGVHYAVVLLQKYAENLNWENAKAWAVEQGGELPNRIVSALLIANIRDQLQPRLHWTSDEHGTAYAWDCFFGYGGQSFARKGCECSAVAVRLISLDL